MVKIRSVYDSPGPEDGFRLLIMRKWPRGIAKEAIHEWLKDLGPSLQLLDDWHKCRIDWEAFRRCYREEVASKPELMAWLTGKAQQGTITMLCGCKDEQHCHRLLLKQLIEEAFHDNRGIGAASA